MELFYAQVWLQRAKESLQSLTNTRYNTSAVIACSVTVLSLAVGAFTQQAVKTVPCSRPILGRNATIPIAPYAHPFMNQFEKGNSAGGTLWALDATTKANIVGALGDAGYTRPPLLQDCTTGDCTFASVNDTTHVTSGYCSRCVETTSQLRKEDVPKVDKYPNGTVYATAVENLVRL
jgi:hypothetical protein